LAVLVTRPHPDNETTAATLRASGYDVVLAPALRLEPVPFAHGIEAGYSAVIVTSANALRAVEPQLKQHPLLQLPLFAVGEQTAAAARRAGFVEVISADGDAAALRECVVRGIRAAPARTRRPLLYLAGADLSRDLAGELGARGIDVVTRTTYRMIAVMRLPGDICEAFAANRIEAVLHYSTRSARAFLDAARAAGVEISALALPQCCISASVAQVLREAGCARLAVAASPNEDALLSALAGSISAPRLVSRAGDSPDG
jgi:uroporphyrinogen-III synthase